MTFEFFPGLAAGDAVSLVRQVEKAGDFVRDQSGTTFWLPLKGQIGGFSPWMLRAIADELDRRNVRVRTPNR